MRFTFIYVLKCPLTEEIRYVGKTNNPKERYHNHLNRVLDKNTHKRNWINYLREKGLKPVFEIIKKVPIDKWKYYERYYIKYYKDKGCKLVNVMDGGEGLTFGNHTSFKKGQISYNKGTGHKEKCIICGKEFEVPLSRVEVYKCCSVKCRRECRKIYPNSGQFKKGSAPWNKGVKGYNTSRKGQFLSEETKQKISNTLKGRFNNGNSKSILQLNKDTYEIINEFPSAAEASRKTGIPHTNIINASCGFTKTSSGFRWKKKEN